MKRAEFCIGEPVEPVDLWFRDGFIDQVWEKLRRQHVLISAPRRTGKTSVMKHLATNPRYEYLVVYQNVQDLAHPAQLFQTILENFYEQNQELTKQLAQNGFDLLSRAVDFVCQNVDSVSAGGFKIALRKSVPDWEQNWKQHGESLLAAIRKSKRPVLLIIDELPDLIVEMRERDESLVREFLAWFRVQRQTPSPSRDNVRWLVGGSVNLASTLDELGEVDAINDVAIETLPVFTHEQVCEFVSEMLSARDVQFDKDVPLTVAKRLGRPIPFFLQLATQEIFRSWRLNPRTITTQDVHDIFDAMIRSQAAQDKLQHYYSRIKRHYLPPKQTSALAILGQLSQSTAQGLTRRALQIEFFAQLDAQGFSVNDSDKYRQFNQLMRDLENDFYIVEINDESYDFASGLMKAWWKKYYA
ncbi:MAG: hypothetical protein JNK90_28915 [Planctomycetaceae bacterium]|nr:hypothetical protein [Planctomycetaceae bacterium]